MNNPFRGGWSDFQSREAREQGMRKAQEIARTPLAYIPPPRLKNRGGYIQPMYNNYESIQTTQTITYVPGDSWSNYSYFPKDKWVDLIYEENKIEHHEHCVEVDGRYFCSTKCKLKK